MPGVNMPQGEQKTSLADIAQIAKVAFDIKQGMGKNPSQPKQKPTGLAAQLDPSLGGGDITPTGQSDAMDRRLKQTQYGVA